MKFFLTFLTVLSNTFLANAFPALDPEALNGLTPEKLSAAIRSVYNYKQAKRFIVDVNKPIEISGNHAFQAPGKSDQRGPCPGLNALANHGYIARNGITSFAEVVTAINQGKPRGLQGSHNWLEADASLTRNDYYVTGDSWTMNMTLFREFYDRADENGVLSLDLLADQAARRWDDSVATNPNFYYGPVTGMICRNAGILFLGRLLANHTAENPDGILTQHVLKKFFAVYETANGYLEYRRGQESIPENWYRKPVEYGLGPLNLDLIAWIAKHPVLGSIGGNTGTVNSFIGLDMTNITSGVLNAASLVENNNLLCFAFEVLKTFLPNSLSGLLSALDAPISLVSDVLAAPVSRLACPAWRDLTADNQPLWDGIQKQYPGAAKAGSSL
ncbi:hypothetical protein ACEQ8H_001440 [Pleosporales sp. CAS-2024a]